MDISNITSTLDMVLGRLIEGASSPQFYYQCGFIIVAVSLAYGVSALLKRNLRILNEAPRPGRLFRLRKNIHSMGVILFPVLNVFFLILVDQLSTNFLQKIWLIKITESIAIVFLLYMIIVQFVKTRLIKSMIKWVIIPIALLQVFGWLDEVTTYLDTISLEIGNIRVSAYGIARLIIFGMILFWLGRISNNVGQQIIRNQDELEIGTREVLAKLFQVSLFVIIFILLLQLLGINLTALAVFGGALGVGLGFGLQSIASNFISGIIILLDRSITVGDYIQLEDGRSGTIRELNMRSAIIETYDGKDIMVPNEQFISTNFVNWTHKNKRQRYPIEFQVAYDTDLDLLFKVVRETVASHPKVLSGDDLPVEERPDAEIAGFGESGIDILVEFWMEGIDDGENRVGADLMHMIWNTLKEHNIQIPYPQREVKILNPK